MDEACTEILIPLSVEVLIIYVKQKYYGETQAYSTAVNSYSNCWLEEQLVYVQLVVLVHTYAILWES